MGSLMRARDWESTAVGRIEDWPQSLRTSVSIVLESNFPMYIAWGGEYVQFYNDGYLPIMGASKHPQALGIRRRSASSNTSIALRSRQCWLGSTELPRMVAGITRC